MIAIILAATGMIAQSVEGAFDRYIEDKIRALESAVEYEKKLDTKKVNKRLKRNPVEDKMARYALEREPEERKRPRECRDGWMFSGTVVKQLGGENEYVILRDDRVVILRTTKLLEIQVAIGRTGKLRVIRSPGWITEADSGSFLCMSDLITREEYVTSRGFVKTPYVYYDVVEAKRARANAAALKKVAVP